MTLPHIAYAWLVVLVLAGLSIGSSALGQGKSFVSDDAAISARVRTALEREPALRKLHISIDTQDAMVRLGGFVRSMTDMGRAIEIARDVEGVTGVRNRMQVANQPSRASLD